MRKKTSGTFEKPKKIFENFPISGWLYAVVTLVYCETLLHLWVAEEVVPGRFAAVLAFALGFGGLLGQIASFLSHRRWGKWVVTGLVGLVSVLYIVEFFVNDAYMSFMPMGTLLGGAKGVATDFGDVVIDVVVRDFWRIIVMLLPTLLYALFARPVAVSWKLRWFGLVLALAGYLGGFGLVRTVGTDAERLGDAYNFDSAIRCFGLNMGLVLDTANSGDEGLQTEFVVVNPPQETKPAEKTPEESQPAEVAYQPNVMDFDFAALAETETNSRIARIHQYVNTVQPTYQNAYTGLFKGKNLIVITAEAMALEVIDPEWTPTLYRLATKGIQFKEYYQPMWGGSTSSGEFAILTGLVSASGTNSIKESMQQDLFLSLGKQLKKEGYHTVAYHNHLYDFYDRFKTHPLYGYDQFMGRRSGMEEGVRDVWPESDLEMMDFTVPLYIDKQPFHVYYMTVSGHCRYNFLGNAMSKQNQALVENYPGSNTIKAYMACQLELEFALESLVRQLEEAGIADDTVIVLSTDHYPYGLEPGATWNNDKDYVAELYGYDPKNHAERDHNALILWSGCLEDKNIVVEEPVYSLDILPTLSNLFGLEYDSRLLVGRDVFSDAEAIALWYDYTWVTEKGTYDSESRKFIPKEGKTADEAYIQRIKDVVYNKIYYSREVQNTDYFNYLAEAMAQQ